MKKLFMIAAAAVCLSAEISHAWPLAQPDVRDPRVLEEALNEKIGPTWLMLGTNPAPVSSVAATGSVVATGTGVITNGATVTINDQTYTFTNGTPTVANHVALNFAAAVTSHTNSINITNLLLAASVGGTNNPTLYATNTTAAANVTVAASTIARLTVSSAAGYHGSAGNAFTLTNTLGNITTVPSGTLLGGVDGTAAIPGTLMLHGTNLSFCTVSNSAGSAVWHTK